MLKRSVIFWFLTIFCLSPALAGGTDPDDIEFIQYPLGNKIFPVITVSANYDHSNDTFLYMYDIFFEENSEQNLFSFDFLTEAEILDCDPGGDCRIAVAPQTVVEGTGTPPLVTIITDDDFSYGPGTTLEGTLIHSSGLPGIIETYTEGDVPPPSGGQVLLPPDEVLTYYNQRTRVVTVGPIKKPEVFPPSAYASFILEQSNNAVPLGWVSSSDGLISQLDQINSSVTAGNNSQATAQIQQLLSDIESLKGSSLTQEGYSLVRPNLLRLLSLVQPIAPTELSLPADKDTTLRAQSPNRNEGANSRLFLSHRLPVKGRSNNPLISFNLDEVALSQVTRATLVLHIDECDLPRRQREGRGIIVQPIIMEWSEGNGRKHKEKMGGKTRGFGEGATWKSPSDSNIKNRKPDAETTWNGARDALAPLTAPPVIIVNGQTGTVEFDVTQDVLSGFTQGWIIRKLQEEKFGNIRFTSREGASLLGDDSLAPHLILELDESSSAQRTESFFLIAEDMMKSFYGWGLALVRV